MRKKGFELSVNFLVIIIIAIVIIGLGTAIFKNIFSKAGDFKTSVDENTQRQLDSLLDTGEKVVILRDVRTVNAGDSEVFYLGIRNDGEQDDQFNIDITDDEGFEFTTVGSIQVPEGEARHVPIRVNIPTDAEGSYTFTVNVNDGSYGKKNLYLNVR